MRKISHSLIAIFCSMLVCFGATAQGTSPLSSGSKKISGYVSGASVQEARKLVEQTVSENVLPDDLQKRYVKVSSILGKKSLTRQEFNFALKEIKAVNKDFMSRTKGSPLYKEKSFTERLDDCLQVCATDDAICRNKYTGISGDLYCSALSSACSAKCVKDSFRPAPSPIDGIVVPTDGVKTQ